MRDDADGADQNAVAIVKLDGKRFLVDLLSNPGELRPVTDATLQVSCLPVAIHASVFLCWACQAVRSVAISVVCKWYWVAYID